MKILASIAFLIALSGASLAQDRSPVKVHVMAAKSADGFVEGGSRIQDSVKDIRDILSDKGHNKAFLLVDSPDAAELIYEVKFSGQVTAGTKTEIKKGIFGGLVANSTATNLPAILVLLRVPGKEYTKEFSHTQQMFWKDLAKQVVYQLDQWVVANIATLRDGKD
jgi:hypothetical protein